MRRHISQFLDTQGDGDGTENAIGDYSTVEGIFKITAQPGDVLKICRVLISIVDAGINNADVYAGAGVLSNGIHMYVTDPDGAIAYTLTDKDHAVTTIGHWSHYCFDINVIDGFASGEDHVIFRWTFKKAGRCVELLPGWSLVMALNDSFTTLTSHMFLAQGYETQREIGV